MKPPPAPIRFLLLVVGGWMAVRTVAWLPAWHAQPATRTADPATPRIASSGPPPPRSPGAQEIAISSTDDAHFISASLRADTRAWAGHPPFHAPVPTAPFTMALFAPQAATLPHPDAPPAVMQRAPVGVSPFQIAQMAQPATGGTRRWSASAWLFFRDEGASGLAPGGTLGGSQAGLRIAYRLNNIPRRPLSLSGRLYLPVNQPRGAEAAIGLDWQPFARLPIHILAERRERLGDRGRSDFGVTLYGGVERRALRGRVRFEAYAQAGIVGVEDRDLFADGAVRAGARIGPVDFGAGAWGGAQPGASRLDVGPHATVRIPVGGASIRASADWRFRVAGDAAPGSGPTLTIATGF